MPDSNGINYRVSFVTLTLLSPTQYPQLLRNNLRRKHGMPSVIRMQATQHAVLRSQRFGHARSEINEDELLLRRMGLLMGSTSSATCP